MTFKKQIIQNLQKTRTSSLRCNSSVKALGDRLKAKGKKPKIIIIAAMHKLLRIIFAILKKNQK